MGVTAKSVVFDVADNWGFAEGMGVRCFEFWFDGSIIPITSGFTAYSTTKQASFYAAAKAFNTSISKVGSPFDAEWVSNWDQITNQRLIIVFDSPLTFDSIVCNNSHNFGSELDRGIKNLAITATSDTVTSTIYAEAIPNGSVLWSGVVQQHIASNVIDDQVLVSGLASLPAANVSGSATISSTGYRSAMGQSLVTGVAAITAAGIRKDITKFAGRYTLTITGTPPTLIPCANFLARMRSGRRSYLQATIPYTPAMADIISARPTEDLELRFYDSAGDEHIVLTVALDGVQITKGVQSSSIVLTGWRQSTNSAPATHADIQAMTVSSGTNSSTMLMPGYRPEIKPADTVQAEGVSFAAGLVTVQGAARQNDIEVRTTMSEEATV